MPDAAHLDHEATPTTAVAAGSADPRAALVALGRVFEQVRALADRGEADDAAAMLAEAYSTRFDPIERLLMARDFATGQRLEARYVGLRGQVAAGLKGEALARACDGLRNDLDAALSKLEATPSGGFGPAFVASLVIILREGVEVILLLSMLIALVAKTAGRGAGAGPGGDRLGRRPGGRRQPGDGRGAEPAGRLDAGAGPESCSRAW